MKAIRLMSKPFFVMGFQVTPKDAIAGTEDTMEMVARWCGGEVLSDKIGPYIQVPVINAGSPKRSQARYGTYVLLGKQRGYDSYKVYEEAHIANAFLVIPDFEMEFPVEKSAEVFPCTRPHLPSNVRAIVPAQGNHASTMFRSGEI